MENGPVEIVGFPMNSMVIFHSYVGLPEGKHQTNGRQEKFETNHINHGFGQTQRLYHIKSHKATIFLWYFYGFPMLEMEYTTKTVRLEREPLSTNYRIYGYNVFTKPMSIDLSTRKFNKVYCFA